MLTQNDRQNLGTICSQIVAGNLCNLCVLKPRIHGIKFRSIAEEPSLLKIIDLNLINFGRNPETALFFKTERSLARNYLCILLT